MTNVIKRNSKEQKFNVEKIYKVLNRANNDVEAKERMTDEQLDKVISTVLKRLNGFDTISTETIDDFVEMSLTKHNKYMVLKAYQQNRENKHKNKKFTPNEELILAMVSGESELRGDNANKNIDDNGAQRDYMAGITSKSITNKILPKNVKDMHVYGLGHFHDADYHVNREHNCDLLNVEDMFNDGFLMGKPLIKPDDETSFSKACNLLAQINLIVSGRQYGGQTISWIAMLPFISNSRRLIRKELIKDYADANIVADEELINRKVEEKLRKEIYEGVKTYQYQILCHSSSNGQTPFVSNNLCLRECMSEQEMNDFAIVIEEIFKRRIKGIKDEKGNYTTPLFPKLLYWLSDGINLNEGDKYFYLTKLAAECCAKRMQPDINSERESRKIKNGQIIPSMGCRSWLSAIWEDTEFPIDTKFMFVEKSESGEYTYDDLHEMKDFSDFENKEYICPDGSNYDIDKGYGYADVTINFRGNTGWLVRKNEDKVIIRMPKVYGRWNNGVFTINLPHVALTALKECPDNTDERIKRFYQILDERLLVCKEALIIRYRHCAKIKGKNSAILWMHGALARIGANDTVGDLMKKYPKRASISLGYVGLYETCRALIGQSNTTEEGQKLSIEILTYLNNTCDKWKKEDVFVGDEKNDIFKIENEEEFEID